MTEPMTKYTFTLKGGKWWTLTQAKLKEFRRTYPNHDMDRELLRAIEWCQSNTPLRKTASGMHRFINGWLGRAKGYEKTKLYPIKGKLCSKDNCCMPAVYKNSKSTYDWYSCSEHMPERVKELFC